MKKNLFLFLLAFPMFLCAQGYVMYETHYINPDPGKIAALSAELTEHNQTFHASGPNEARVFYVISGPRTGQLMWVMGPTTFSDFDNRPTGADHAADWNQVQLQAESLSETEYWRRNDDLSIMAEDSVNRPLSMVRFFDVADNGKFIAVQQKIKKVMATMSNVPRVMYQKEFESRDERDWAVVRSYTNWAEMDAMDRNFRAAYERIHGADSWEAFTEEFDAAVISREDELRFHVPEMSGAPAEEK